MNYLHEIKKSMKIGYIGIGIMLIAMSGFYFHAVEIDFDKECAFCITSECMDSNFLCGDFGVYYFKFFTLIGIFTTGVMFIIFQGNFEGLKYDRFTN